MAGSISHRSYQALCSGSLGISGAGHQAVSMSQPLLLHSSVVAACMHPLRVRVSCSPGWSLTGYVVKDNPEFFLFFQPPLPKSWDDKGQVCPPQMGNLRSQCWAIPWNVAALSLSVKWSAGVG